MDGSKSGVMPWSWNQQCPSRFTTTIRRLIRPTNRSLGQQPITARDLSTRGGAALPDCRTASSYFLSNTAISHRVQRRHAARTTSHPVLRAGAFPVNAVRKRLFCDYTAVFRSGRVTLRFLSGKPVIQFWCNHTDWWYPAWYQCHYYTRKKPQLWKVLFLR